METFNNGYTQQSRETKENRSYKEQAANALLPSMTAGYETFKYIKGLNTDTLPVVLMQQGIEKAGANLLDFGRPAGWHRGPPRSPPCPSP